MITITNPIQKGFYPDPSICRVGNCYYMVHSTFAYAPGIPVFKSYNLKDWIQIGHVLERETQLSLVGAKVSQGIYAPSIRFHEGKFYVISTNVSGGGNFYLTAENPEGTWSEPVFLKEALGIDPSLFFEEGRCYYIGQRSKEKGTYDGDCEIWIQELDLKEGKLTGIPKVLFDGSMKHTVWAEGPHIYKKGDFYYLMLAEGGTEYNHSITVARSRNLYGPYESCPWNPILTHRHMGHEYPIQNIGHGDLIERPDKEWFMVMLGTRLENGCDELGRETFLAKVSWENDWPVVNPMYGRILIQQKLEGFDEKEKKNTKGPIEWSWPLDMRCLGLRRNPAEIPKKIHEGRLHLPMGIETLDSTGVPSYIGTRLLSRTFHVYATVESQLFQGEEAGLVYYYDENHYIKAVIRRYGENCEAAVIKRTRNGENVEGRILIKGNFHTICLQGEKQKLCVLADGIAVAESIGLKELCSQVAGGFTGCTVGVYAWSEHKSEKRNAVFGTLYLEFWD